MKRCLTLAALLVLAGCSALPRHPGPGNERAWQVRNAALLQLDHWTVDGRVAIAAGDQGGSGSMTWWQSGSDVRFRFDGPFGWGGLRITGDGHLWLVRSSRGDRFTTAHLGESLEARFGWTMPIASMRYWIVGVPDPALPSSRSVDDEGRLITLKQDGWKIDYYDYGRFGSYVLPTRLSVSRPRVRIKLAINAWQLGDAGDSGPEKAN